MLRGAPAGRPFRLLFVGRGVSSIGDGVAPIALAFAVLGLTGSGTYALQPIGLAAVGPIALAVGVSASLYGAGALAAIATCAVLAMPVIWNFAPADSSVAQLTAAAD